jgi:hypothetical protein
VQRQVCTIARFDSIQPAVAYPSGRFHNDCVAVEVLDHEFVTIPLGFGDQDRDAIASVETKIVEDRHATYRHARPNEIKHILRRLIDIHIDMNEREGFVLDCFQMIVGKYAGKNLEILATSCSDVSACSPPL